MGIEDSNNPPEADTANANLEEELSRVLSEIQALEIEFSDLSLKSEKTNLTPEEKARMESLGSLRKTLYARRDFLFEEASRLPGEEDPNLPNNLIN